MSTEQGKKIDEIKIDWQTKLIVRYHADDQTFTVEAGDQSFHGDDIKELVEKGKVHMNGWSKLVWTPIISVSTEIYHMTFEYQRCFKSKHKGKDVYRMWKVDGENEASFGSYVRGDTTTGDIMKGEPGMVMGRLKGERILPYTPERWTQIRNLSKMLSEAMEKAAEKLSELLSQKDLDGFLAEVGSQVPRMTFGSKVDSSVMPR